MYCPHSGNRHPLHLGHPHLHPHFPRGNREKKSPWNPRQTSSWATKSPSTGQGSELERPAGSGLPASGQDRHLPDLVPGASPLGCYQQMQRSVSSYGQRRFSASSSSYWLFSGHMLSCYAHQVASQFFYFSSFRNSGLNVKDTEKWSRFVISVHLTPQEILLAQQKTGTLYLIKV